MTNSDHAPGHGDGPTAEATEEPAQGCAGGPPEGAVRDGERGRDHDGAAAPHQAPAPSEDAEEIAGPAVGDSRLTPRQARRLRIVLSSVGMAAMAVVLALRIASRSSVLVVGVYGLALILCGVVIELSRNGRTRLGSWLLGIGLVAAVAADQLLIP
ncbi:cytochrome d ubiquinol oxidase subunit II [Streptomyces sp. SID3915]|uniref:cytochrome d ubiquinol oxidase subunit II n=1 Tax=Streptomyces sp. SID3915 TaxID=2690263 RepID=UPI0013710D91|nr:cytochrome d ubiquinol oxidase subunit II [Streptomyces sp. SID3915]MYX76532.1 hypothetical protein [Streptomyces sp. SID3915]